MHPWVSAFGSLARLWSTYSAGAQRGLTRREITRSETMDPKSTAIERLVACVEHPVARHRKGALPRASS
jgi:hypothetical protein